MTTQEAAQKQEELTQAYSSFAGELSSCAFSKVHDRAICEDLVQDTFIRMWKYLIKGGRIHTARAFLYHVLNQLIIDQYRKRKNTSLDVLLEKGFEPRVDYSKRLSNVFDGRIAIHLIKELPRKYQRVIRMRYVQNLSLEEMSHATKQSKNAVAVQAHRGLEQLKKIYNHTARVSAPMALAVWYEVGTYLESNTEIFSMIPTLSV